MFRLLKYLQFAKAALTIGCFVALGVFLWPGALAAVMGFSVLGFSLGAIVGASVIHQVAAVAASSFVGLHVVGLAIDATMAIAGGIFNLFKGCFSSKAGNPPPPPAAGAAAASNMVEIPRTHYQTMTRAMPPAASQGAAAAEPKMYPAVTKPAPREESEQPTESIYPALSA